jgi:hypothetical protein
MRISLHQGGDLHQAKRRRRGSKRRKKGGVEGQKGGKKGGMIKNVLK